MISIEIPRDQNCSRSQTSELTVEHGLCNRDYPRLCSCICLKIFNVFQSYRSYCTVLFQRSNHLFRPKHVCFGLRTWAPGSLEAGWRLWFFTRWLRAWSGHGLFFLHNLLHFPYFFYVQNSFSPWTFAKSNILQLVWVS